MRAFKSVLNSKGLLAASIAVASSTALAETAGRVSFVSGEVTASSADGVSRQLQKGDTINSGDKISTRSGRLQIRFTDGGFVSLQPNTIFGVDQYLYASKPPEETSLFFSLLQGGMRTVTGAIGKVNKQSYKVRTPVATIGIRGTGYLASLTDRGLIVSVGSGFVNVANDSGQITGGAGQNIGVRDGGSSPGLTTDAPDVTATGVDGERSRLAQEESRDTGLSKTVAVGNVQNENGDYLFLFTTEKTLPSSDLNTGTPRYFVASPINNSSTGSASTALGNGQGLLATFDKDGSITGATGGLTKLYYGDELPADPASPDFDSGTLHVINAGVAGVLGWGEFTNGSSNVNNVLGTCSEGCETISADSSTFIPYIVGMPALSNLAKGTATYNYQGGPAPRSSTGQTGKLDSLRISVNLDFATMDLAMQLTTHAGEGGGAIVYNVTTSNGAPVAVANLGTSNLFHLDSSMLDVTSDSGACSSNFSCSADIGGFFAGEGAAQIGLSYKLNSSLEEVQGVAALGMTGYIDTTPLSDGPGYTSAFAYSGASTSQTGSSGVAGDYTDDPRNSLTLSFNSVDGGLDHATDGYNETTYFSRTQTTAKATGTGSSGTLKWGRWYSSANDTVTTPDGNITLPTHRDMHYIVGPMTQPNIFLAFQPGATATYTYQSGTGETTGMNGTTGTLSGQLLVTFGAVPTLAVDLGLSMSNGAGYHISSNPLAVGVNVNYGSGYATGKASFSANTADGSLSIAATTSGACFSGSGCSGSLDGFFSGQQAQQIGLAYNINDQGLSPNSISGTGGFQRGTITPPLTPPTNPVATE
ncbi:MAG: FecR family protein [Pedobacter sp.]|nr:FecR family protein [Pedobacter sp.]